MKPLTIFWKGVFMGSLLFLLWGLFCLFGGAALVEWLFRKPLPQPVIAATVVGMPIAMLATLSGTLAHPQRTDFRNQTLTITLVLTAFFAAIAYFYLFVPQSD